MYDTRIESATSIQIQMYEAAKARRARMARPLIRTPPAPPRPVAPPAPPPEPEREPAPPPPPAVIVRQPPPPPPRRDASKAQIARRLVAAVAFAYDLTVDELLGERRHKYLIKPRYEAIARVYEATGWSLPQIGRFFGDRDHTSIMHALKRLPALFPSGLPPMTFRTEDP